MNAPAAPSALAPGAPGIAEEAHAALHASFAWHVPERFNIAEVCVHRWARDTPQAVAIVHERENGARADITYLTLQRKARRLSNALRTLGVERGDRVAVILPQRPQTATALMGILQMGAIAVPLSTLFGPEALEQRLADSGARVAIVDELAAAALKGLRRRLPGLAHVIGVGKAERRADHSWTQALADARPQFDTVDTAADEAAMIIYTSGTTGPPKGALIAHRGLIGNLSGFVASQNWFLPDGGPFWSPADWAWTGGLWDALMPTLYFGRAIVAWSARFDAAQALGLMERLGVTHTFLFPTALKAMMRDVPQPRMAYPALRLRAVMSAGEAVGESVFAWCREHLGVRLNEMFGQTEANYIVGNCGLHVAADGAIGAGWPARPGSMGRPYPGHRVSVLDDAGQPCGPGVEGDVAVHARDIHGHRDPVLFLGYWHDDAATRARWTGEPFESWFRTGDRARRDAEGYFWYAGRGDDQFKTSGYRVGPAEIEACLARHPAVGQVAVCPKPDPQRGAVVKAFIVAARGVAPTAALVEELQQLVRSRLAPYETPKEIEFVETLPMTTTGKIRRAVLRMLEEDRASGRAPPMSPLTLRAPAAPAAGAFDRVADAGEPPAGAGEGARSSPTPALPPTAQAAGESAHAPEDDDDITEYALREPIPDDEDAELADEDD